MANQFTPPTTKGRILRDRDDGWGLWRHYNWLDVGVSVLIETDDSVTEKQVPSTDDINNAKDGSGQGGKAAFIGGRTYEVTDEEKTILEGAGYTVNVV